MSRTREKQIKLLAAERAERRRIRRGRQLGVHAGIGHGERVYVPVKRTNFMPTFEERLSSRFSRERTQRGLARLLKALRQPKSAQQLAAERVEFIEGSGDERAA